MRIMLINPKIPMYQLMPSLPLGLISIASYLRAKGDKVKFIDRSIHHYDMAKEINAFRPHMIGISCISYQSNMDAKKITKLIRTISDAPIVWGGQAPSSLPEMYLKECHPDYISLGEGEITIYECLRALEQGEDFSRVQGLAYLNNSGEVIYTPQRPVADLTAFPELDWSFVDVPKYFSSFFHCNKMVYLHASKGCTAFCTFCSNRQFHQGKNRYRDPNHVLHDLEYLVGKCGADGIYFSDELFLPNRTVRNHFLTLIKQSNLNFVWGCQVRLGVLTREDLDAMYDAGCRWILFGIESGCPEVLQKIKKGTDISLAMPTVSYCEKIGITVQASFIIGFPHETKEQIQQTVDLAKKLPAGLPVLNILTPMPNSEIYNEEFLTNPKFKEPKSLKELAKLELRATNVARHNLSAVSGTELHVLHYYFQWKDFIGKESVNDDSFGIIKKMALDTIDRIFKHGFIGFFYGTFFSARQFFTVFFYSHFFPKVLKEYHLK